MSAAREMLKIKTILEDAGHEAMVPYNADKYSSGEYTLESSGESVQNKIAGNLIREYFREIQNADAVIVANFDKKGIRNYIGGNSFLEAGFAHALGKRLYFMNGIPELGYSDELIAMQPFILDGDLGRILTELEKAES
jgi:nucleoside 2-deoxyribosyltransferase